MITRFTLLTCALLLASTATSHAQQAAQGMLHFTWDGSGERLQQFKSSKLTQLHGKVVRIKDEGGWLYALESTPGKTTRIIYEGTSSAFAGALAPLEESGTVVSIEGAVGRFESGYQSFEDAKPIVVRLVSTSPKTTAPAPETKDASGISALTELERQLACMGSYQKDIGKKLVAAQLAIDKQYIFELKRGSKLYGFDATSVSVVWDVDPTAKVTIASLNAKVDKVRAALGKAGVNLARKSPPFVVVIPESGASTMIACAWDKPLEMP